jgi:hypothetical protein
LVSDKEADYLELKLSIEGMRYFSFEIFPFGRNDNEDLNDNKGQNACEG